MRKNTRCVGAANSVCKSTEVFAPSNSVRKHAKGGHGCAKAGSAVHLAFTGGRSYPDMCSLHLLQDFYDYGDEEGDEQMAQGEQVGASTRHGVVWLQAAPSPWIPTDWQCIKGVLLVACSAPAVCEKTQAGGLCHPNQCLCHPDQ